MWIPFVLASTLCWALINVLDSVIVHNYEKHPVVLMWCQSFFSVVLLLVLPFFIDLHSSPWIPYLMLFGAIGLLGDFWFFHVLDHVDVSITNAAWAILSLFLSIAGFIFFQESWTLLQSTGAALIIGGSLYLAFSHKHISMRRTLGLLMTLALLYTPYYIMKKTAIDAGEGAAQTFYWMILGREILAFNVPWFIPSIRSRGLTLLRSSWGFSVFNGAVILCFFLGEFLGALAYNMGPLSLVSIVGNTQPFMVMALAWLSIRSFPGRAPRELLTRQAVSVKLFSFCIMFFGLMLLTTG